MGLIGHWYPNRVSELEDILKSICWVNYVQRYKKLKNLSYKEFDPDGKNRLKTLAKIQVVGLHGIVQGVVINLQE